MLIMNFDFCLLGSQKSNHVPLIPTVCMQFFLKCYISNTPLLPFKQLLVNSMISLDGNRCCCQNLLQKCAAQLN